MGVDAICYVYVLELNIAIANPFMCDIAHRNVSHTEQIAPCEHFHKPTCNPFRSISPQRVNEPWNFIVTGYKQSCAKVMFSVMPVCHSVILGRGFHVTISHDALDLTVQGPTPTVAFGGQNSRSFQTCSLEDSHGDIWYSERTGCTHPTWMLSCFHCNQVFLL